MTGDEKILSLLEILVEQGKELKTEIEGLKAGFEGLKTGFEGLKAGFEGLKTEVEGLKTDFDKLETKVDKLETKVDKLDTKVDKLDTKVDGLDAELSDVKEIVVLMEHNNKERFGALFDGHNVLMGYSKKTQSDIESIKGELFMHDLRIKAVTKNQQKIV